MIFFLFLPFLEPDLYIRSLIRVQALTKLVEKALPYVNTSQQVLLLLFRSPKVSEQDALKVSLPKETKPAPNVEIMRVMFEKESLLFASLKQENGRFVSSRTPIDTRLSMWHGLPLMVEELGLETPQWKN